MALYNNGFYFISSPFFFLTVERPPVATSIAKARIAITIPVMQCRQKLLENG